MKIETVPTNDGFHLVVRDGGDRVRFASWSASDGDCTDSGRVDISMVGRGQAVAVYLGWKPAKVVVHPLRDSTPGMHQSIISYIPQGVSLLEFVVESGNSGIYQVFASSSGQPHDTRSMGMLAPCSPGTVSTVKIAMTTPWTRLFIKKMADSHPKLSMSRFKLTVLTGEVYQSVAHLIKAEGEGITKFGKDGIIFGENAPKWSYANLAFQRF